MLIYAGCLPINQSKKQPEQHREKCGQFQNKNNSRTLCEIHKKSASKIRKSEMKMSYKLCNMHRKIFCVNFQIVKIFIFSSFSYSFHLISAWPVHFFSSVPLLASFACCNNLLKYPYHHPAFILSFIL